MPDELSYYGYEQPNTPDWDYKSWMGIGDRSNDLTPGYSAALSATARQQILGVNSPTSTGREFNYQGKTYRDDDTSPQKFANVDVYSPGGVPGSATYNPSIVTPLGKSSGQSLGPSTSISSGSDLTSSQAHQDTIASLQETVSSPDTQTPNQGDSLLSSFKKEFPQHANVDLTEFMKKVAAIHPNIEPVRLEELWTKAGTFQDLANEEAKAQASYKKSFDVLKNFYEGSGDGGGSDTTE